MDQKDEIVNAANSQKRKFFSIKILTINYIHKIQSELLIEVGNTFP